MELLTPLITHALLRFAEWGSFSVPIQLCIQMTRLTTDYAWIDYEGKGNKVEIRYWPRPSACLFPSRLAQAATVTVSRKKAIAHYLETKELAI